MLPLDVASVDFLYKASASHAAFVYLGEGRAKESKTIMALWNGESPPTENPYEKESDLHRVWEVLEEKAQEKTEQKALKAPAEHRLVKTLPITILKNSHSTLVQVSMRKNYSPQ